MNKKRCLKIDTLKIRKRRLTFNKHPKEVGQVEVVQENDDDARAFVGFATVQLFCRVNEEILRMILNEISINHPSTCKVAVTIQSRSAVMYVMSK